MPKLVDELNISSSATQGQAIRYLAVFWRITRNTVSRCLRDKYQKDDKASEVTERVDEVK